MKTFWKFTILRINVDDTRVFRETPMRTGKTWMKKERKLVENEQMLKLNDESNRINAVHTEY